MEVPPIGCILRDMGVLTEVDIDEILDQQSRSGQKFGLIAMRWGLATPEQVWEAWARQLSLEVREADLVHGPRAGAELVPGSGPSPDHDGFGAAGRSSVRRMPSTISSIYVKSRCILP